MEFLRAKRANFQFQLLGQQCNVNKQYFNVKRIVSDSAVLGTYCFILFFASMYCNLVVYVGREIRYIIVCFVIE